MDLTQAHAGVKTNCEKVLDPGVLAASKEVITLLDFNRCKEPHTSTFDLVELHPRHLVIIDGLVLDCVLVEGTDRSLVMVTSVLTNALLGLEPFVELNDVRCAYFLKVLVANHTDKQKYFRLTFGQVLAVPDVRCVLIQEILD